MRITEAVHREVAGSLRPGGFAVDATCGNGHDTLFLARTVGPEGRVLAVDIQSEAIASTHDRLDAADLAGRVELRRADHAAMDWPPADAVLFNLGYLPGGDHALTTRTESTLAALESARTALRSQGLLCVVCYPGHPEGAREAKAVAAWAAAHGTRFLRTAGAPSNAPFACLLPAP